jgi:uncharacterized integral membrane protein (TIGR00698 family)
VLLALGVLARVTAIWTPGNALIVAVLLGFALANTGRVPDWAGPGIDLYKLLLEAGIVVMGARVMLDQVLASGVRLVLVVIFFLTFAIALAELFSQHFFDLESRLGSLLAAGSGVCGVSAVVAVAGGVKAGEEQIAYAVATILLFDAITLFAYPVVGGMLALPDQVYGVWAGVSMFSTGPVAAAGFAFSEAAGQWATLTKLTRNVFIGFVAVSYSLLYARRGASAVRGAEAIRVLWETFPKFVFGFVLMMAVANAGMLTTKQITSLKHAYSWLFTFAFVGLGMNVRLDEMRETGVRPVLVVLATFITTSVVSLGVSYVTFGG